MNHYSALTFDEVHLSHHQNIQVHHQIYKSGVSIRTGNAVQHNQTRPNLAYILQPWKLPTHNLQHINTLTVDLPLFMPEITLPAPHTVVDYRTCISCGVSCCRMVGGGGTNKSAGAPAPAGGVLPPVLGVIKPAVGALALVRGAPTPASRAPLPAEVAPAPAGGAPTRAYIGRMGAIIS